MRIVYFSSIYFTDCDFPLIRAYQNRGDKILYVIKCNSRTGGLFNIKTPLENDKLYKAQNIPELAIYSDYMDLSNVYIMTKSNGIFAQSNYKNYNNLINLIRKFNPDVVHITGAPGISELLTYRFSNNMVLTVHDPFTHSGETNLNNEWKRFLAFHLCKRLILLNESQEYDFERHYHISNSKVFINRLGIYDCLSYLANKQVSKLKLPEKYILFFGHFSPYKGIDILCKSMVEIHKSHPNIKCIIAGKGDLDFNIDHYKDLNYIIIKNEFIETQDLASLISHCMFTVCPYKDATQSGVVASSFTLCKPVVATRVGGLPETVIDNVKGLIAEPNNVSSLTEKICYLLDSPDRLHSYEENIKREIELPNNSWAAIANNNIDVYKTLK